MSWSDRLQGLRNGSLNLATAAEGQVGKLLRRVSARPTPVPAAHTQRFEPRRTTDSVSRPELAGTDIRGSSQSESSVGSLPGSTKNQPAAQRCPTSTATALSGLPPVRIDRLRSFDSGEWIGNELEVIRVIGRDSFFDTYLARHHVWQVDLTVKVPGKSLLSAEGGPQSIVDAAAKWTALGLHPHIVYCYALQVLDGIPVLLLEHAGGGDLRTRLDEGSSTDLRFAVSVGIQLCTALEHAHAGELWHGAVTPEHILFATDGSLLLGDLGIAARCRAEDTPVDAALTARKISQYLAPESRNDAHVINARTDIFSLGVCLQEMLYGNSFDAPGQHTRSDHSEARFGDGGKMPERLARLLADCTARDASQRPARATDVRQELCAIYEEQFLQPSPFAQLRPAAWRADGWNNQALVACWQGKYDEATTAWNAALNVAPGHVESTFNRALMRWRWGEISDEDALTELEQLIDPHTRGEQIAHLLGMIHLERGDAASALSFLERAASRPTVDDEVLQAVQRARSVADSTAGRGELSGHDDFVSAVTIHPDRGWVLSAGDDCRLILWDAPEGRPLRVLTGHIERLSSVCLNADGNLAVSASDDATLKVWDTQNGTCLKSIATAGAVFSVALSADGRRAVSSSSGTNNFLGIDNTVLQVWDVEKERCLGELVGHTSAAKAIALTADGQTVFSAGDDHTVRIWDPNRLSCRRILRGHQHYVTSVCATPGGDKVLSGSWDQTVRLWDPGSGECVRVFTGTKTIVTCVAVSGDGRTAASGCWDGSVRLWEVETGRCIRTFTGHSRMVTGVAVSADGQMVVSGSWDGTVRVWKLSTERSDSCVPRWSHR